MGQFALAFPLFSHKKMSSKAYSLKRSLVKLKTMKACSHRHGWSGNNNLLAWDLAQLSVYSICVLSITRPKVSVWILIYLYLPDVVGPSVDKLLVISVTAKEWFWTERLYFKRLKTLLPGIFLPFNFAHVFIFSSSQVSSMSKSHQFS